MAPKRTTKAKRTYEDLQDHIPSLTVPVIDTFRNVYTDRPYTIDMTIPEFTAICPKTGLPDFGILHITYVPDKLCLELKSLKEYIVSFRSLGIFHENVVNKVLDDLVKACKPRSMTVQGDFNIRGGIHTEVSVEYVKGRRRRP